MNKNYTRTGVLAVRLRSRMDFLGITVESLALESGYSEGYISRLLNGVQSNPTIQCVECLATVLDIQPSVLVGWEY